MADISFSEAVSKWIDAKTWPRSTGQPQSILVLIAANAGGTVFTIHSAFSYFEIVATYHQARHLLTSVRVALVVPGFASKITLMVKDTYRLATASGEDIPFDIGNGVIVINGKVSFKYAQGQDAQRNIFITYSLTLSFAGDLEDTINIAPTQLTTASGFTSAELEGIPALAPSQLKLEEEKALVSLPSRADAVQAHDKVTDPEHELFLNFLEYSASENGLIHYFPAFNQCEISVRFLILFELVGCVNSKLSVAASLFIQLPITSRIHITSIKGSLLGTGVVANINVPVASGKAIFTASRNSSGKHDLYIDLVLSANFIGPITTAGKVRLLTLPF